ncbi:Uncharacterized protein APZ42_001399, partial [Daphnia magna]
DINVWCCRRKGCRNRWWMHRHWWQRRRLKKRIIWGEGGHIWPQCRE